MKKSISKHWPLNVAVKGNLWSFNTQIRLTRPWHRWELHSKEHWEFCYNFLLAAETCFFSLKRDVGDSSYTSFSSSSLVGTMSADTLIACPLACQALSSMYRSVTRSYTSLFSRKCQKGKIRLRQFLRNPRLLWYLFIRDRNLKKLKFLTSFAGPRRFSAKTKSQQTGLRGRSYAQ